MMKTDRRLLLAGLLSALISPFSMMSLARQQTPNSADVPVAKGEAGPCSADFVVRDPSGKGVYDAKIGIQIKYGFMGLQKLDRTVGTNFEGKARVEGLPEQIKGSFEFKFSHGNQNSTATYDHTDNCHPCHQA